MSRTLILLFLFWGVSAVARPIFSLGTGIEGRLQQELNPEFAQMQAVGQLFAQAQFGKFGALLEVGQDNRNSNMGGLSVDTLSTNIGAWGRYEIVNARGWRPFAGAGLGMYFDRVTTTYGSSSTVYNGRRGLFGVGAGIARTLWKYVLMEGEGRASLVEDREDPMYSLMFRLGVQI